MWVENILFHFHSLFLPARKFFDNENFMNYGRPLHVLTCNYPLIRMPHPPTHLCPPTCQKTGMHVPPIPDSRHTSIGLQMMDEIPQLLILLPQILFNLCTRKEKEVIDKPLKLLPPIHAPDLPWPEQRASENSRCPTVRSDLLPRRTRAPTTKQ